MWVIDVKCLSLVVVCALNVDAPAVPDGSYATRTRCERAIIHVYQNWKQGSAAYSFNCRRVK